MNREQGGAFYYILISIVLLAALAYAITQGSRSSLKNLEDDRISLLASGIMEYGNIVKTATAQLRLRGSSFAEMRFAHTGLDPAYGVPGAAPAHEIFHLSGGGIIYQDIPADAAETAGPYVFTAANEIQGIGTTCGGAACADLIMVSPPLLPDVCMEINNKLGVDNPGNAPPVDANIDRTTLFDGSTFYSRTIGDEASSEVLEYKSAGCFRENASGDYFFYQVLLPQ